MGQDLNRVHDTVDLLLTAGLDARALLEPALVVSRCLASRPALVLAERREAQLREPGSIDVGRSLAAFAETADIPVAALMDDGSEQARLQALWAGAVEVFPEPLRIEHAAQIAWLIDALLHHPQLKPRSIDAVAEGMLRHYARLRRSGLLELNPGSPFAGRAGFSEGKLAWADFGPLSGTAAFEEMLWTETGHWRFTPGPAARGGAELGVGVLAPPPPYAPSVLVADDDPELRDMLAAHLAVAGFNVRTASDGRSALETARGAPPDLIIADLEMPELDGWGLLRAMEADYLTREVTLAVLSAHDDWREALRGARAGPVDFLPKSWRMDDVVRRAQELTAERERAYELLRAGKALALENGSVGVQWTLRALARLRSTGVLEVSDARGEYAVLLRHGAPLQARSTTRRRQVSGAGAVADLLVCTAPTGAFLPATIEEPDGIHTPMEELLSKVCAALNRLDERDLDIRLTDATAFEIDDALYTLFRRVASHEEMRLAQAVCEEGMRPAEAAERLALSPDQVHEGLKQMVRRGVIRFANMDVRER